MIFPEHCRVVGVSDGRRPCGDMVYFLTRYLVVLGEDGEIEIYQVETGPGTGYMRPVEEMRHIAGPEDVTVHPEPVNLHNRGRLIELALGSPGRCTVFRGHDEHLTFVIDPDPSAISTVHVYDITPPRPHLSETIRELESVGIFGIQPVRFVHHLRDIRSPDVEVYPCSATGFERTVDRVRVMDGERVTGCRTTAAVIRECGGARHMLENLCPLDCVDAEPYIARCCRSERCGIGIQNGLYGAAVHWGATPWEIAVTVMKVLEVWKERADNRRGGG